MATLVDIEKLPLSEEARQRMRAAVASGAFASVEEHVADNLERANEAAEPWSVEELRTIVAEAEKEAHRDGFLKGPPEFAASFAEAKRLHGG